MDEIPKTQWQWMVATAPSLSNGAQRKSLHQGPVTAADSAQPQQYPSASVHGNSLQAVALMMVAMAPIILAVSGVLEKGLPWSCCTASSEEQLPRCPAGNDNRRHPVGTPV